MPTFPFLLASLCLPLKIRSLYFRPSNFLEGDLVRAIVADTVYLGEVVDKQWVSSANTLRNCGTWELDPLWVEDSQEVPQASWIYLIKHLRPLDRGDEFWIVESLLTPYSLELTINEDILYLQGKSRCLNKKSGVNDLVSYALPLDRLYLQSNKIATHHWSKKINAPSDLFDWSTLYH